MLSPALGVVVAASLAVVGLGALALLGWRVRRQVRDLGHEVDRLAELNRALDRVTTRRSGPG